MKVIYLICVLILLGFAFEKKYTLSLTEPEVNILWNVIDKSTAPHTEVKYVQELINKQFAAQVDTTLKPKK